MAKKRRRKKRRSGRKKIILFVFEILLLLIVLLVVWAYNKTLGQVKYEDALTNSEAGINEDIDDDALANKMCIRDRVRRCWSREALQTVMRES